MANELRSVFTQAGQDLLSQILAGKGKLSYTRGVASVADWSSKTDEDLQAATKLDDETQVTTIGEITNLDDVDGNPSSDQINVALKFMQNEVKADYAMRVVGLFACLENDDGTKGPETLYTVTVFPQAQWMVVDKFGSSVTVQIATVVGSTDQINVILADDQGEGGISQGTLSVFKNQLTSEYDKKYALKTALDDLLKRIGGDGTGNADPIITQSALTTYLAAHHDELKGDKGAKGDKGDPGTPGAKGDPGAKGTTGTTGAPGKDAPQDAITAQQFTSALGFKKAVFIKQADYDKLATKDPDTAYFTSFDS